MICEFRRSFGIPIRNQEFSFGKSKLKQSVFLNFFSILSCGRLSFWFFVRFLQIKPSFSLEKDHFLTLKSKKPKRSIFLGWFACSDESIDREKKEIILRIRRIRNWCSPPIPFNTPIAIISWIARCLSVLGISINSLQLCITNFPRMHLVYYRGFEINKLLVFDTSSGFVENFSRKFRCSIFEKFLFAGSQVFWLILTNSISTILNILNIKFY